MNSESQQPPQKRARINSLVLLKDTTVERLKSTPLSGKVKWIDPNRKVINPFSKKCKRQSSFYRFMDCPREIHLLFMSFWDPRTIECNESDGSITYLLPFIVMTNAYLLNIYRQYIHQERFYHHRYVVSRLIPENILKKRPVTLNITSIQESKTRDMAIRSLERFDIPIREILIYFDVHSLKLAQFVPSIIYQNLESITFGNCSIDNNHEVVSTILERILKHNQPYCKDIMIPQLRQTFNINVDGCLGDEEEIKRLSKLVSEFQKYVNAPITINNEAPINCNKCGHLVVYPIFYNETPCDLDRQCKTMYVCIECIPETPFLYDCVTCGVTYHESCLESYTCELDGDQCYNCYLS